MIYFGHSEFGSYRTRQGREHPIYLIKIGFSGYPPNRICELTTEYGNFKILAMTEGGLKTEEFLHKRFEYARMEGRSYRAPELFYPVSELLSLIEAVSNGKRPRKYFHKVPECVLTMSRPERII